MVSQLGQDRYLMDEIYPGKRDGYFVDVGAHDGRSISNTWLLERDRGWRGVCVEPLPVEFGKLRAARPQSHCVQAAVTAEQDSGDVAFTEILNSNMLSGLDAHLPRHVVDSNESRTTQVRARTLTSILNETRAPAWIDYLSVDTEGSELEVLRGIDFSRYTFGFVTLEHNYDEPRRTEIREFLAARDYVYHRPNQWDDDYVHASLNAKLAARK